MPVPCQAVRPLHKLLLIELLLVLPKFTSPGLVSSLATVACPSLLPFRLANERNGSEAVVPAALIPREVLPPGG